MARIISTNRKKTTGRKRGLQKSEKKAGNFSNRRLYVLFFLIFAISGAIFFRLVVLQVFAHNYYAGLADNQHSALKNIFPERGEIYLSDSDGNPYPVAINQKTKMVYVTPREIDDFDTTIRGLVQVLNISEEDMRPKFSNHDSMYRVIKKRLTDQEVRKINELKLKGVHLADEVYRYYPAGELASNVLGFIGWKGDLLEGRYGIEAYFEDELKGKEGQISHKKDNSGRWISFSNKEMIQAQNGDDLYLTIDYIIQYETERLLKAAVEKYDAKRGAIIVMEPKSGDILSLASYPNFNPNNYSSEEDMESFRNLVVSDPYECGSVFKTITLAAAVDNGKINPQTTYVDTGKVKKSGYTIRNSDLKSYGTQTMTQVLEKSLNTGAIYAEKLLGNKTFYDYVKRFGFGENTGIALPGERAGNISNLEKFKRDIQFYTASFGQGITVTPIQLISAYNAIANGGNLMKPQIVKKVVHSDGSESVNVTQEIRKVISQSTANQVSQMLQSVVDKGHGKRAAVPGYKVGGKTGTAQVASHTKKGYSEEESIGSFAGFAPLDNPQFTIVVRLDNPRNVEWAESSAAPVFGELMKFLLDYKKIPPTEIYTQADLDKFYATHNLKEFLIQKEKEDEEKNQDEADKKNDYSGDSKNKKNEKE